MTDVQDSVLHPCVSGAPRFLGGDFLSSDAQDVFPLGGTDGGGAARSPRFVLGSQAPPGTLSQRRLGPSRDGLQAHLREKRDMKRMLLGGPSERSLDKMVELPPTCSLLGSHLALLAWSFLLLCSHPGLSLEVQLRADLVRGDCLDPFGPPKPFQPSNSCAVLVSPVT